MSQSALKSLPAWIRKELELSRQLLDLLQQEQQCLSSMALDTLPELAAQKQHALNALQQATQTRMQAMQQAGYSSLEQLAGKLRMPPALKKSIDQLRNHIERAQELNTQNGMLIHRGMLVNQQLRQIFSGEPQQDTESALYPPKTYAQSTHNTLLGEA